MTDGNMDGWLIAWLLVCILVSWYVLRRPRT
jgi:hypothetical protein